MYPPSRVLYSALLFLLVMGLLVAVRPAAFFAPDGRVRPFGLGAAGAAEGGAETTAVPLGAVTVIAAVLSMFVFSLIDVAYARAEVFRVPHQAAPQQQPLPAPFTPVGGG